MKILVINYEYPPIGGGGGEVSQFLSEGYAQKGHDVCVLTAHWDGLPKSEIVNPHLRIERIFAFRKFQDRCNPLRMLAFMIMGIPAALRIARQWKPDVVHCHFAIPVAPIAYVLKLITGIPYIITLHGGDVPGHQPDQTGKYFKIIRPFANLVARQSASCVAVGKSLQKLALMYYSKSKIEYISNGVDIEVLKPLPQKTNKCIQIIFAGRFYPEKALQRLLYAADILKKSMNDFEIKIFGKGPKEEEWLQLARKLNLMDKVHFHGWVSREELGDALTNSDIFAIPSDIEGMPIACLQAMACGLAIVGSRTGGIDEVVIDGENGILVDVGDVKGLAEALEKLIKNRDLIKQMGVRSREIVCEKFSWDAIVEEYLKLLQDAAGK